MDCARYSKAGFVNVARTMLDEEISVLEQQLSTLRHKRNDLAPILRLPPEILAEILILASHRADYTAGDLWCRKVAHVCRYFRAVALDCPRLWCHFPLCGERWVDESIRRSRLLPLSIHCNVSPDCKSSGLDRVAEDLNRIRELSVHAIPHLVPMNRFWRHFMKPAPTLQVFSVTDPFQMREHSASHVPSDIFAGETPALRTIEIRQCTFCWHSALFCPTVTSLFLQGRRICLRPMLYEVLSALASMPLLERATLDQVLPDLPWDADARARPAAPLTLEHLVHLHVDGLALNCAALLSQLRLPTMRRLVIACQPFRRYDELRVLGTALSSAFDDAPGAPRALRSFTFRCPTPETLHLHLWTDALPLEALRASSAPPSTLEVRVSWDGASPNNSVRSLLLLLRALPIRAVRAAHIPEYVPLTARAWREMFARFVTLEQLSVDGRTAAHLPAALAEEPLCECPRRPPASPTAESDGEDAEGDTGEGCALFPALRQLRLESVDFAGDASNGSVFFAQLQEAVLDRKRRAPPLRLSVRRCRNFVMEQMEDLEMLGAVVDWDADEFLDFDIEEESDEDEEEFEDYYDEEEDGDVSD